MLLLLFLLLLLLLILDVAIVICMHITIAVINFFFKQAIINMINVTILVITIFNFILSDII